MSGIKKDIAFGGQIGGYVLPPLSARQGSPRAPKKQVGDINRILDGDLDGFIKTYLMELERVAGRPSQTTT